MTVSASSTEAVMERDLMVLDDLSRAVARIYRGEDPNVKPGQAVRFPEAASVGVDGVRQGDLYLIYVNEPVKREGVEFELIENVTAAHLQLVPGNNVGAKHALREQDLEGLVMYRPKVWNEDIFVGPFVMHPTREIVVQHPTHGAVTVPAGMGMQCTYQREWDRVQKLEVRARD